MSDGMPNVVPFKGGGSDGGDRSSAGISIPAPPPGHNLDRQGKRLYDWICTALINDGRKVGAAGIQIVLLVHTFLAWSDDMKLCVELGRYGTSDKGNQFELPHSYNERQGREQIKRELPEACLTVMSQIEARLKESKTGGGVQDDLFADLVEFGRDRPNGTG